MNFTREPIIETVITPREGCKLVIRSSKGGGQEDYFVDAVEVVSFGHSLFFRSQERPKSFLVPVSDYEILELKEARMVLKNVSTERAIKIGGGREAAPRYREEVVPDPGLAESRPAPEKPSQDLRPPLDRKRDKRRRGRRGRDRGESEMRGGEEGQRGEVRELNREELIQPVEEVKEIEEKAPSFISKLFPPPPTLIKESLSRYKALENGKEDVVGDKKVFEETIYDQPPSLDKELEDESEE